MPEEQQGHVHPSFANVIRQRERVNAKLSNIKHKIGVYSAKGGVGKTTISLNIAYTLCGMGFKVGILDADIDCPNLTLFAGIHEMMDTSVIPLKPIIKDGIAFASTAMLVDDLKRPIIWRGPMVAKMVGDFLENTDWGELDYLIIDLCPGTSDAPLSIMQLLKLDGIVIVTTPQRIAGINSIRSGLMAKRMNVAVLGVVENMSQGEISNSTREVIEKLGAELLGTIKNDAKFNSFSDAGRPSVIGDALIKEQFLKLAEKLPGAAKD